MNHSLILFLSLVARKDERSMRNIHTGNNWKSNDTKHGMYERRTQRSNIKCWCEWCVMWYLVRFGQKLPSFYIHTLHGQPVNNNSRLEIFRVFVYKVLMCVYADVCVLVLYMWRDSLVSLNLSYYFDETTWMNVHWMVYYMDKVHPATIRTHTNRAYF